MMKTLFIVGLLIAITFAYNGLTPRSDQSCADKHVPGVFWDGQKCDVCANANCYCNKYLGCDSCTDGYSLFTVTEDKVPRAKCYKCPDNVKTCCFHGVGTLYDATKQLEETDDDLAKTFLVRRALSCYTSMDEKNKMDKYWGESKRYGGYCQYIRGCLDYNNYGQCHECMDGYYMAMNTYTTTESNVVGGNRGTCRLCEVKNCEKCQAPSQCSMCMPGFFMETNLNRFVFRAQNEIPASKCTACEANCLCDGKITVGLDIPRLCTGCISDRYFPTFAEDGKTIINCAKQCDSNCEKCVKDSEGAGTTCLKCYEMIASEGKATKYYSVTVNKENQCVECPSFCSKCRLVNNEISCMKNHCFNGTYEVTNEAGTTSCVSCDSSTQNIRNVLRCKGTGQQGRIEATQCGETLSKQSLNWTDISTDETHVDDDSQFYLLGTGINTQCVHNDNYCKTIDPSIKGIKDGLCSHCYEDKGYQLQPQTRLCLKCDIYNGCVECSTSGGTTEAKCTKCRKGLDAKVYGIYVDTYTEINDRCQSCNNGCKQCDTAGHLKCDGASFCQSGFYWKNDGTKECGKCDVSQCATCTNGKDCNTCFPGYSLYRNSKSTNPTEEDHKCVKCHPWCRTCGDEKSGSNRRMCTECNQGYYIQDGVCHKPRKMCQIYSVSGGACNHCEYGWRVVNGYCHRGFAADLGYVNIEYGCATNHRVRDDGDLLTREEFADWLPPLSGSILSISAILFAVVLSVL